MLDAGSLTYSNVSDRPVVLKLDALIPSDCRPSSLTAERVSCKRARRKRHPDGRRIRIATRRQRAIRRFPASNTLGEAPCEPTGLVDENWWAEIGLWAIDSANANSWGSAEQKVVGRSRADVVMLQKTKLFSDASVTSACNTARFLGWNPVFSLALRTAGTMGSGGCAVLTRKGSGIAPASNACFYDGVQHRLCLAWVDAVVRGGIHNLSVYLRDSEGLSDKNQHLLEQAAVALRIIDGPWVAAGDWNISPQTLASSGWLDMVGGVIFATELPTCNENTYDFFVVHRSLAHAVAGVQRLEDGGMNPHWPTRLIIRGDARRFAIRKLIRPPKVEGILPFGPSGSDPCYDHVTATAALGTHIDKAMVDWYSLARQEWASLTGTDLSFCNARFKWAPAIAKKSSPWAGSTAISCAWRASARRANDARRVLLRGVASSLESTVVDAHVKAADFAHKRLCRSLRAEHAPMFLDWARAFRQAVQAGHVQWFASLASIADRKAMTYESTTAARRLSDWRVRIGAKTSSLNTVGRPTKAAYRWVRGLARWNHSPMGDMSHNDAIPSDPVEENDDHPLEDELSPFLPTTVGRQVPLSDQATVEAKADE